MVDNYEDKNSKEDSTPPSNDGERHNRVAKVYLFYRTEAFTFSFSIQKGIEKPEEMRHPREWEVQPDEDEATCTQNLISTRTTEILKVCSQSVRLVSI